MLKCVADCFLRNLVKGHAEEFRVFPAAQQFAQMPGNGFAFAVRVGTEINLGRRLGGSLEFIDNLDPGFGDFVGRLEFILNIDAEALLG